MSTPTAAAAITDALSQTRLLTYERAVAATGYIKSAAVDLYDWNAQVSAAFMAPLHICEVVIRNAVSDALTAIYGAQWPWSSSFERSLPSPPRDYNPRRDLITARHSQHSAGKVVAELKFVFWQKMFTDRHDVRIWNHHLRRVLPHADANKTVTRIRQEIYADLERIRFLRNRIAHHEPIFKRDLYEDFRRITELIELRSKPTANWMRANQRVTEFLANQQVKSGLPLS
jgi:hypothetical protein